MHDKIIDKDGRILVIAACSNMIHPKLYVYMTWLWILQTKMQKSYSSLTSDYNVQIYNTFFIVCNAGVKNCSPTWITIEIGAENNRIVSLER